MKKISLLGCAFMLAAMPSLTAAGWHFGEAKDLDVDIQYFDYAFLDASGQPVYYIGSQMRYAVTLKNNGSRTFNNFQSKSQLLWSENVTCQRFWFDNQPVSFQKDALLPGNSDSGLRPAGMRKDESAAYTVTYPIPLEVCPGSVYIKVEGRHRNQSGKDEAASFTIPTPVKFQRK